MKTILIVDDNAESLYFLETLLKGSGYGVMTATNGSEALESAYRMPPDLIISDILMPVMDGFTLCRKCKADEQLKHIPFIFYTATYTEPKDEQFALSIGADSFILKPQEPETLINIMTEFFKEKYMGQPILTKPLGEEMEFFRQHNEILFKKLENKMLDLETANRRLRYLEEQYRLSFENVTDIVWTIDVDFIIQKMSPSVEKMLGYKPQDFIGQSIIDLVKIFTPELMERAIAEMRLVLSGQNIPASIYLLVAKDGTVKHGEISGSPIFRNDGEIVGMVSVIRDITKRKQAEEESQDSQEYAKILFHSSIVPQVVLDAETGSCIDCNKAAIKVYGYESRDDMVGKTPVDVSTPTQYNGSDSATEVKKHTQDCLRDGFCIFEWRHQNPDGRIWDADVHMLLFRHRGKPLMQLTVQDITERKKAENELKESRQQLKKIIDFLPYATFVIDNNKKIIAWNRACEEMTGVRKEDIIGKGDYEYAVPFYGEKRAIMIDYVTMDSDELQKRYESIRTTGDRLYAEAFVPAIYNGKGAFLSGHASPLYDSNGNIAGAIECLRDLTEVKHLETQLRQSQKMEAIGTLAGGVAHDFNNILTAIIGYGSLLQMQIEKDNPLRIYADQVLSSAQKAVGLTQSLLAFSRQQPINLAPLSINNIIKGTETLLKRLLTEDINLKIQLSHAAITIMADTTQIDQILINLATNARDSMQHGGTLTIETKLVQLDDDFVRFHGYGRPGRYALISVTDTGTGMDAATQERIFDPFFTTKESGKGTGLGLSTVYGIIKQHDGYINVCSEPGQGTTFNIYLHAIEIEIEDEKLPSSEITGGTEKILIAEDNTDVRCFMKEIFNKYGYIVIEAIDGEDAVNKFKEHKNIDLLILDSVMPKKNGRKVYDEIRLIEPHIKALFTSGYTRDIVLDKGIEDKEIDFISKPLTLNNLLQKVREVLDK